MKDLFKDSDIYQIYIFCNKVAIYILETSVTIVNTTVTNISKKQQHVKHSHRTHTDRCLNRSRRLRIQPLWGHSSSQDVFQHHGRHKPLKERASSLCFHAWMLFLASVNECYHDAELWTLICKTLNVFTDAEHQSNTSITVTRRTTCLDFC